jgi:hypothetical protein
MPEMYVKVYKRKRDGSYTANLVKHSYKKGKAVKIAKINI